jgi:DNA replicative helicase MCM subunit Mcm2 (Cdc46/Mcm family)
VLHVLQGIVTQITDVKPLATVVSYIDEDTNREVFQEVGGCPPD